MDTTLGSALSNLGTNPITITGQMNNTINGNAFFDPKLFYFSTSNVQQFGVTNGASVAITFTGPITIPLVGGKPGFFILDF